MAGIRSLVKDTAIYGLSSIVGRFLNWCLVPLYTIMFPASEFGVVTYVYSVVAIAMIVLTYGMETGFFRFANHERWPDPMRVYSTALISLASSSTLFIAVVLACLGPISEAMECGGHESYVAMMAVCVALDAFTAMPFSYLRYRRRAVRFATVRLVNIGINIGLNLLFILGCPKLMATAPWTVSWFYRPDFGIGYIFLSNLIASAVTMLMLIPELRGFRWRFDATLWRQMLVYSAPLLVLGVAGIMNQTLGNILYPMLAPDPASAMNGLGIYGANYKIAIVMVMFIQAFRFAYEPFLFAQSKDKGGEQAYSDAMKMFVIFALLIFLAVMFYLDVLRYFISPRYFSGLGVVPVVMIAELCFGVFFNLSVWYKLTDRTIWGAWFSLLGLAATIGLNALLVPRIDYMGCAWAALGCYALMMVASYVVGRRLHPISYPVKRMAGYCLLAAVLYVTGMYAFRSGSEHTDMALRTVLLAVYVAVVVRREHLPLGPLEGIINRIRR